jgi:hypothetical protein
MLLSLGSGTAFAADEVALRWGELRPVIEGRQLSISLQDGATVNGKFTGQTADSLSINVSKTSDPAKHSKGVTTLNRSELARIVVKRHRGWKARTIGLIAGGAIADLTFWALSTIANNEGGWNSAYAGVGAGAGAGAIGIGYAVGWGVDAARARPERVIRIIDADSSQSSGGR